MSWSNRYIGIPWSPDDRGALGTHCWGLVRLVYAEQLDIDLPDLGPAGEREAVAATIAERRKAWPWHGVIASEAQPFDVVVFRIGEIDDHVGLIVGPRLMLHVSIGGSAMVSPIDHPLWSRRIVGCYRHADRVGRP